jgi:hypothetical protein
MTKKIARFRDATGKTLSIAVLISAFGCGGSPASPDGGTHAETGFRVSGVVTDDTGARIPGATVILDHGPNLPDLNPATVRLTTRTASDGSYAFVLAPNQLQPGYDPFAMILAYTSTTQQHFANAQSLVREGSSTIRNIRLSRMRRLGPGETIVVAIDSNSSLCDFGNGASLATRCEWVRISYPNPGRITIEARSNDGTSVPTLRTWNSQGQGTLVGLVPREDFYDVDVAIEVPAGAGPQQYTLTTSLH